MFNFNLDINCLHEFIEFSKEHDGLKGGVTGFNAIYVIFYSILHVLILAQRWLAICCP